MESSSANGFLRVVAAQVGGEDLVERAVGQHRAQAHDQGGIPAGGVAGARSTSRHGLGEGLDRVRRQLCGPAGDPAADRIRAAGRFQDEFLAIVADLVGERNARHYGALLLTSAHGIADMELSGHLGTDGLRTTSDELVDTLVRMVTDAGETT